jgi:nicotinamidase-related amidase
MEEATMTRRTSKVILGGMLANLCVESHRRELVEQGFEVVVKDATAAPRHPEWGDGDTAALINFTYLAKAVMTTDEVIDAMNRGQQEGTPRGI